jgi:hypothetical protein
MSCVVPKASPNRWEPDRFGRFRYPNRSGSHPKPCLTFSNPIEPVVFLVRGNRCSPGLGNPGGAARPRHCRQRHTSLVLFHTLAFVIAIHFSFGFYVNHYIIILRRIFFLLRHVVGAHAAPTPVKGIT